MTRARQAPKQFARLTRAACLAAALATLLNPAGARAQDATTQIVTDGTFGDVTDVQGIDGRFDISENLGYRAGGILLHSFDQFDVGAGDTAAFSAGSTPLDAVISRVTGGLPSQLFGAIESEIPGADVYFLNPAGILFGPESSVDVSGSFFSSTADSLIMRDDVGNTFPAFSLDQGLGASTPAAFGFSGAPIGTITVDGASLEVDAGETLGLIGGDLELSEAHLAAPGGQVLLISVNSAGEAVVADDGAVDVSSFDALGRIELGDDSSVSVGAAIEPEDDDAPDDSNFAAAADADDEDEVAAGTIIVRARSLSLRDASLSAVTNAEDDGATLGIDVELTGDLALAGESSIETGSGDEGGAGAIRIQAASVALADESEILSTVSGEGFGGAIAITAANIELSGDSEIGSDVEGGGSGTGGHVSITADRITLRAVGDSAPEISSDTEGAGDAGGVSLSADVLRLESDAGSAERSGVFTNSKPDDDGVAGGGNAGPLDIQVGRLELINSDIVSRTETAGRGGDIAIAAGRIDALGSSISAESTGSGDAGNIRIFDNSSVNLVNSRITTEALSAYGGNVSITSLDEVFLRDSSISTDVGSGVGDGGNIDIDPTFVVLQRSEITANAVGGDGGNIDIVADYFVVTPDSRIEASSQRGIDGEINVTAPEVALENGVVPLPVSYLDAAQLLSARCAARAGELVSHFVLAPPRGRAPTLAGLLPAYGRTNPLEQWAAAPALARKAAQKADLALQTGRPDEAIAAWAEAIEALGSDANRALLTDALRLQGVALNEAGRPLRAAEVLERALKLSDADPTEAAATLNVLAVTLTTLGQNDLAADALHDAHDRAGDGEDGSTAAAIEANLGSHHAVLGAQTAGLAAYERAAKHEAAVAPTFVSAVALANAARLSVRHDDPAAAAVQLERATRTLGSLPAQHQTVMLHLYNAETHRSLAHLTSSGPGHTSDARDLFQRGLAVAEEIGDDVAVSLAAGGLGALDLDAGRYRKALAATYRALRAADRAGAVALRVEWSQQLGRAHSALGEARDALSFHRVAVATLEEEGAAFGTYFGVDSSQFSAAVRPVYLDLAQEVLAASEAAATAEQRQTLLREARDAVEQFRTAELQDYFRDECAARLEASTSDLDTVSATAAVVYPVMFPDRTELIVGVAGELQRYSVPVGSSQLSQEAARFRRLLTQPGTREYVAVSRTLFDWLVRPYADWVSEREVDTLVFVSDGMLRNIPMAALHDGHQFVVERFASAVTPSLRLVNPQPIDEDTRILIAGVSDAVQGFPALPGVDAEVATIEGLKPGHVLLNREFEAERIEAEINEFEPGIVHLATHAEFTGRPETSFLLTYDDRMTMNRLGAAIGDRKFDEQPLALLVLSACSTAAGDERSALGLAGSAISAGARSAVGSLWSISDEATANLVRIFYRELGKPAVSRAEALQRAQLALIADRRWQHPYYWSAFILISDWL